MYSSAEQNHKDIFWEVLVDVDESYSRKNYDTDYQTDPNDEHWTWWSGRCEDVQFQAVNCHICGEYQISNTVNSPQCMCETPKDNWLDEEQRYCEHEATWKNSVKVRGSILLDQVGLAQLLTQRKNEYEISLETNNFIQNIPKKHYPFVKTYTWISIGDTEYDNIYM
jgi:hypothetical protein